MGERQSREGHRSSRVGWLRAAVLGADDGLVSTASLMIGVASSSAPRPAVLLAGMAGAVAGAMSMAAGEYVSVSSQRDAEDADVARESKELATSSDNELRELTEIYVQRGLKQDLARQVAIALTQADALGSHLRDELGITPGTRARPVQAALTSALSFAAGSLAPLLATLVSPHGSEVPVAAGTTLAFLAILGALGGKAGGASPGRAAVRVLAGGALAMTVTALIGRMVGLAV